MKDATVFCGVVCLPATVQHNGADFFLDPIILSVKKASIVRDLCFCLVCRGVCSQHLQH